MLKTISIILNIAAMILSICIIVSILSRWNAPDEEE